jgi:hypothetical protein
MTYEAKKRACVSQCGAMYAEREVHFKISISKRLAESLQIFENVPIRASLPPTFAGLKTTAFCSVC